MQQINLRESYQSRRESIREHFAATHDGVASARLMTEAVEEVLLGLWARNLGRRDDADRVPLDSSLSLVAIGGFGRREQCPFSDVDVLLLQADKPSPHAHAFVGEFVRDVWDAGLSLGQNVGTSKQLVSLAAKEVLPATALLDARHLAGSTDVYRKLETRLAKNFRAGGGMQLFLKALEAVREDQRRFGDTVHQLEPNVKRTAGGLRDIHLVHWAAAAIHGTRDLAELETQGTLGLGDAETLQSARGFLLRVRFELHFHAGKLHDDLLRADQVRIAKEWGYEDGPAQSAVEQFMADYFRHATAVVDIVERLVERTRPRTRMAGARELFLSRRVADGVVVGPDRLILAARKRREIGESLAEILELADLAAKHRVRFDYYLTESLRRYHVPRNVADADDAPLSPEESRLFLQFLSRPGPLGQILRVLHRVKVLSRIIPEFEHARCLLQFNAYHKYTVDEHTFVVLDHIQSFADRNDVLGRAYNKVSRKDLLHLAVLLHDLGKGYPEDHSEVGRRLAQRTADRLGLNEEDRQTLIFLVHKHLMLSDLALKRDISDPRLWVYLGKQVGDGQVLRMLYSLTCADIMGVGAGVFSAWTSDLLEDVYRNTLAVLGEVEDARSTIDRCAERRQELLSHHQDGDRIASVINSLPVSYLAEVDPSEIEEHLQIAERLSSGDVEVLPRFRPETKTTTYTVFTTEQTAEHVFSKICGGLAAHHLDVLKARIYTLDGGTVIDQFDVRDTHFYGDPTPDRVKKVAGTIRRLLKGELSVQDALYSTRSSMFGYKPSVQAPVNTTVSVDNATSEACSVIDVFTNNRRGLLYTLAQSLARLGLSVQYAKIATYEDEAADVFYVQEDGGGKVEQPDRVRWIEEQLAADVYQLATNPRAMGF